MAVYSKTPLAKKLGLKGRTVLPGMPAEIRASLEPLPNELEIETELRGEFDSIHIFAESAADLARRMPALKKALAKTGMLWVSWRKGRVDTDLTENEVRRLALAQGLVDVKVCAVDATWSGLKLVYRLKDR